MDYYSSLETGPSPSNRPSTELPRWTVLNSTLTLLLLEIFWRLSITFRGQAPWEDSLALAYLPHFISHLSVHDLGTDEQSSCFYSCLIAFLFSSYWGRRAGSPLYKGLVINIEKDRGEGSYIAQICHSLCNYRQAWAQTCTYPHTLPCVSSRQSLSTCYGQRP